MDGDARRAFARGAARGCHIALNIHDADGWVLGHEAFDADDYEDDVVMPDVALDVERARVVRVSVTNVDSEDAKAAYVSVYDVACAGRRGRELERGRTRDDRGRESECTTFIVIVPAKTLVHLCRVKLPAGTRAEDLRVESDVRAWARHSNPRDTHAQSVAFPLIGEKFLCTQSEGGELTHFFSGNLHAVDFRCDEGTPVVAAGDGVVVGVRDEHTLTGIAVGNLFAWNSIILKLDARETTVGENERASARDTGAGCSTTNGEEEDFSKRATYDARGGDLYVEYVHIRAKSSKVRVGDRVRRGEVICYSGSVGFSPEPHLHFTAFRSADDTAETCRVLFEPENDPRATYVPVAGRYYNAERGRVE